MLPDGLFSVSSVGLTLLLSVIWARLEALGRGTRISEQDLLHKAVCRRSGRDRLGVPQGTRDAGGCILLLLLAFLLTGDDKLVYGQIFYAR